MHDIEYYLHPVNNVVNDMLQPTDYVIVSVNVSVAKATPVATRPSQPGLLRLHRVIVPAWARLVQALQAVSLRRCPLC